MNRKILLVSLNARYSHSNLAVYYLYQSLANRNIDSEIIEMSINTPLDELLNSLYEKKAEVYCFSVYIWNVIQIRQTAVNLKKLLPESIIVFGGPEVSYNPLEYTKIADYVISGPGEHALADLASAGFKSSEHIIYGKGVDFESSGNPYKNINLNCLENKIIYYEASRGCIFKCSYCLSSREDMQLRRKSIQKISDELDHVLSYNPDLIKFVDRSFNCDREFSLELWKVILEKTTDTKFHFEIHPAFINKEDIDFLKNVPYGKFQFEIGIQSTCDNVNKAVSRFQKWENIRPNLIELIRLKNIHSHVDMITGLPYQSYDSAASTFNDLYNTDSDHIQIGFLKILKGTAITESYDRLIHSANPPYEVLTTDWLSYYEIRRFKRIAFWIESLHNSGKFRTTLKWLVDQHDSPMDFFEQLLDFENTFKLTNNRWMTIAEFLLKMCNRLYPRNTKLCKDYLRWDWCLLTRNLHYPELLKQGKTKMIRKLLYEKHDLSNNNLNLIPLLKKSIIFIPDSDEFTLSEPDEIVMFFHEDGFRKTMHISMKGVIK